MPNMPTTTISKPKTSDRNGQRLYREYTNARRKFLLIAAMENRLLYVQTGWGGEGQHYGIVSFEFYEDGSRTETFDEIPTKLVHDLTYIEEPYLHDVPLDVRLGKPKRRPLLVTNLGADFVMKHAKLPDFDSLDAIDAHYRQFSELEKQ